MEKNLNMQAVTLLGGDNFLKNLIAGKKGLEYKNPLWFVMLKEINFLLVTNHSSRIDYFAKCKITRGNGVSLMKSL